MFKETYNLFALPSVYNKEDQNKISMTPPILNAVVQNLEIIDFTYNWSQLSFLEPNILKSMIQ